MKSLELGEVFFGLNTAKEVERRRPERSIRDGDGDGGCGSGSKDAEVDANLGLF